MRIAALVALCALIPTVAGAQPLTDEFICVTLKELADQQNKDTGTKLDSVTTYVWTVVMCNSRHVDFKKRLDIPFADMRAGWEQRKQDQWNQIYCDNPAFSEAIAKGWRISATTTDAAGKRHYMEAKCR